MRILCLEGVPVPVDAAPLQRIFTDSLAFRGPDAQHIWTSRAVGFCRALLRVTPESENQQQPVSLGGTVWSSANARVDAASEPIRKLRAAGSELSL